jgi:predicted DNA-binding transcriptional regulator YafY
MNRIDRLTAILIQLQSKKVVKAQEISDRFEISLRTTYRDIKALEEAGVPIIGEAGIGYSIMDGYRLPPVMFTKEEAGTFMMAEKILEKYTDTYNIEVYRSALFKIKAVLRSSEKSYLEEIDESVMVLKNSFNHHPDNPKSLQGLLTAIHEKRIVRICYRKSPREAGEHRDIEPVGLYLQHQQWYLIAFCLLRGDYRNFRIDRIISFQLQDRHFETQHPTLAQYVEQMTRGGDLQQVVIAVPQNRAAYLDNQKYYQGFVSERNIGEEVEMTFMVHCIQAFLRWYLVFADRARLIAPLEAQTQLKEFVGNIYQKL